MSSKNYQRVTDRIIAQLEAGTRPWSQSWNAYAGGGRPLRINGIPYRGANTVNLWAASMERGFSSPYWLTYKGAQAIGAQVKKGAASELAFYVGRTTKTETNSSGEETERSIAFLKAYTVFNAEEVEGLASHFYRPAERTVLPPDQRISHADAFVAHTGAKITEQGGRAYYRPSTDEIVVPEFGAFTDAAAYYGTVLHELTHWTGAEKRLDRRTKGRMFGDPTYAFEELVAELGAAFLSADLHITSEPRDDHASYLASWLKALRADNRAIFSAAAHAERACDHLRALQPTQTQEEIVEMEEAA